MINKNLPKLTDAELEIMKVIWDNNIATITEVSENINNKKVKKLQRTTIQVQMTRLEEKGWIKHSVKDRTYYYQAIRGKEETAKNIISDIKSKVFNNSYSELIKCLFNDPNVTQEEIQKARKLLNSYKKEGN